MVTVGALPPLGMLVSMVALSEPILPMLPAASLIWASTVSLAPSPGLAMPGRAIEPLRMSAWVMVIGAWATPLTVVSRVSPATAVAGRVTLTSMLPCSSAALIQRSLLASSRIETIGALGGEMTISALSSTGPALLPAASTMLAVTLKSVFLKVGLNLTSMKPPAIWAAVRVNT
ncbi:hypothetical protein SDC9_144810 [bioreactor metagenome]|uniref:Uncharacterized protein n=1 Tax=bioreactor metagenome TaxID=1076179 RepID=A0A645E827_9ZZZZ